jgi:hypothetical protein
MPHLLDFLADRVLLCDGAMGTQVQARNLRIEEDFLGHENCTEILTESRPDLVREIHRGYLLAGADAIQTNTFGGSPITLGEFGLQDKAFDLNKRACDLAHEAIAEFKGDGRTRFVIGSVGPGTRLPTLGHIAYQPLEDALTVQARGLIAGAVDAILIETCQDPLQIKAAVNGAKRARAAGITVPIVPGILPVTNFAQVKKFAAQCGAAVPPWMAAQFEGLDDDPETRRLVAASIAAEQCRLLQSNGVREFHFSPLNRADLTVAICHMIGVRGRPPAETRKAAV